VNFNRRSDDLAGQLFVFRWHQQSFLSAFMVS